MPPIKQLGQPQTLSRRKCEINILAGPDATDILGLDPSLADVAAATGNVSALAFNSLSIMGTIGTLDITQSRGTKIRYGFNYNPYEAYQTLPGAHKITLHAERVMLKKYDFAEKTFNFAPPNLMFQQMPFLIQVYDYGTTPGEDNSITHIFYGCWFTKDVVKYSVDSSSKEDQRLISDVDITATRMFTLTSTDAGNKGSKLAQAAFGGVVASSDATELINNAPLS